MLLRVNSRFFVLIRSPILIFLTVLAFLVVETAVVGASVDETGSAAVVSESTTFPPFLTDTSIIF